MANVNESFRSHVTSGKFVLTLGSSHIAALVWIEQQLRRDRSLEEELSSGHIARRDPEMGHPLRRAFRSPGTGGIISRGLVIHTDPRYHEGAPADEWTRRKPSEFWTITPAGWAVVTLLVEAGIWQEYSDALPEVPEPKAVA